jgi:hypothetical protein
MKCDCGLYDLGQRRVRIERGIGREGVHRPAGPEGAAPLCYVRVGLDFRWLPPLRVRFDTPNGGGTEGA